MDTYTCEVCAKDFKERLHLRNHFLEHKNKTMNNEKKLIGFSRQSVLLTKDMPKKPEKIDLKPSRNGNRNYMYSYKKTLQLAHKISNEDMKSLGKNVATYNSQLLPNAVAIPLHFSPAKMKYTIPKKRCIQENAHNLSRDINITEGHTSSHSKPENIPQVEPTPSKQRKTDIPKSNISLNIIEKPSITFKSNYSAAKHATSSPPKNYYNEKFGHPKNKQGRSQVKFSKYPNSEECNELISALGNGFDLNLMIEKSKTNIYQPNSTTQKTNISTLNIVNIEGNSGKPEEYRSGPIKCGNLVADNETLKKSRNGKPIKDKAKKLVPVNLKSNDLFYCDRPKVSKQTPLYRKSKEFTVNKPKEVLITKPKAIAVNKLKVVAENKSKEVDENKFKDVAVNKAIEVTVTKSKQVSVDDKFKEVAVNKSKEVSIDNSKDISLNEKCKVTSKDILLKSTDISLNEKSKDIYRNEKSKEGSVNTKSNEVLVNDKSIVIPSKDRSMNCKSKEVSACKPTDVLENDKSIEISNNAPKIGVANVNNNVPQSYYNNEPAISAVVSTITELPSSTEIQPCTSQSASLASCILSNISINDKNNLKNTNSAVDLGNVLHNVSEKHTTTFLPTNLDVPKQHSEVFNCDICKTSFENNTVLNYHKQLHYPSNLKKSFENVSVLENKPNATESKDKDGIQRSSVQSGKTLANSLLYNHIGTLKESDKESEIQIESLSNKDCEELPTKATASLVQVLDKINPVLNLVEIDEEENRGLENIDTLKCCACPKIFKKKCHLASHMVLVHNRPPKKRFTCNICFQPFSSVMSLNDHQNLVHETGSEAGKFKCALCPRSFSRHCSLVSHLHVHQLVGDRDEKLEDKETQIEMLESEYLICKKCQMKFESQAELSMHEKSHQIKNYQGRKINIFKCTRCDKYFSGKERYMIHKESPCHLEGPSNIRDPAYHASVLMQRRKLKLKKHKCSQCSKRFRTPEQLSSHWRIHTGELNKYYKCRRCGKFFEELLELKKHKLLHTNNPALRRRKPYLANRSDIKQEVPSNSFRESSYTNTSDNFSFYNKEGFKFGIKKEPLSEDESKDSSSYPDFKSYNTYLESVLPKFDNVKAEMNEHDDSDDEEFKYWIIPFTNFDMIKFTRKRKPVSYYKGKHHQLPRLGDVYLNVLKMSSKSNGSIECKVPASTLKEKFSKEVVIKVQDIKYII